MKTKKKRLKDLAPETKPDQSKYGVKKRHELHEELVDHCPLCQAIREIEEQSDDGHQ